MAVKVLYNKILHLSENSYNIGLPHFMSKLTILLFFFVEINNFSGVFSVFFRKIVVGDFLVSF